MTSPLKTRLDEDTKAALKGGDKKTLGALRLVQAALKQYEVDQRAELDDSIVIAILTKMAKQRRESITQYEKAERQDLIEQEQFELDLLATYLPQAASDADITSAIEEAIAATGASSIKDMGKVMGILKQKLEGRADFGQLSKQIKDRLGA